MYSPKHEILPNFKLRKREELLVKSTALEREGKKRTGVEIKKNKQINKQTKKQKQAFKVASTIGFLQAFHGSLTFFSGLSHLGYSQYFQNAFVFSLLPMLSLGIGILCRICYSFSDTVGLCCRSRSSREQTISRMGRMSFCHSFDGMYTCN